jgi:hypothetical protein
MLTFMNRTASIAEFLDEDGIEPHEAVAVVQQLIHGSAADASAEPDVPPGPLSIDRVRLGADGSVVCVACDATPAVSEVANLLQSMLPDGTPNVPGALRYTIARARLDVEAPPFDSLDDFSGALARFERGDRRDVVRKLVERSAPAPSIVGLSRRPIPMFGPRAGEGFAVGRHAATPSPSDRRAPTVSVTELRRQLREADQRLYSQRSIAPRRAESPVAPSFGRRFPAIAAGVVVGMLLIGAGEAMHLRHATASAESPQSPAVPESTTEAPAGLPAPQSEPAWHATPPLEAPKAVDHAQPRPRRTPTPVVTHRRGGKSARAQTSGSPTARAHDRSRQTDTAGIFSRIKFKWVDDISTRRE